MIRRILFFLLLSPFFAHAQVLPLNDTVPLTPRYPFTSQFSYAVFNGANVPYLYNANTLKFDLLPTAKYLRAYYLNKSDTSLLAQKATLLNHVANLNNPHQVTASQVGLGNVNNTSDPNKPVSTATQTALNAKVNYTDTATMLYNVVHQAIAETITGPKTFTTSNATTSLSQPTGVTVSTSTSGGTLAAATYSYKVTALSSNGGETGMLNNYGVTTTGSTSSNTITWNPVTGAVAYRVYRGTAPGMQNVYYQTTGTSYTDVGATGTVGTVPIYNNTALPNALTNFSGSADSYLFLKIQNTNSSGTNAWSGIKILDNNGKGLWLYAMGDGAGSNAGYSAIRSDSPLGFAIEANYSDMIFEHSGGAGMDEFAHLFHTTRNFNITGDGIDHMPNEANHNGAYVQGTFKVNARNSTANGGITLNDAGHKYAWMRAGNYLDNSAYVEDVGWRFTVINSSNPAKDALVIAPGTGNLLVNTLTDDGVSNFQVNGNSVFTGINKITSGLKVVGNNGTTDGGITVDDAGHKYAWMRAGHYLDGSSYVEDVGWRFTVINSGSATQDAFVIAPGTGNGLFGGSTDVASSRLTVATTTQGSIPFPKMTSTQIAAISSPVDGLGAYATDLHVFQYYDSGALLWRTIPNLIGAQIFQNKTHDKIRLTTGANTSIGTATLVAGTVTVSNTAVTGSSVILLTRSATGGTTGNLSYTISAGTSFTITSTSGTETSTIGYIIIN